MPAATLRPAARRYLEADDNLLLLWQEGAALEVWPEVVESQEAAALAAPLQADVLNDVNSRTLPTSSKHGCHKPLSPPATAAR